MPFNIIGTLLSVDTGNIKFNNLDVSEFYHNGISVWIKQTTFSAQWTGNSYSAASCSKAGIETSGSLCRARQGNNVSCSDVTGAWVSAYTDGTFDNASSTTANFCMYFGSTGGVAPNQFKTGNAYTASVSTGTITFDLVNGFTGTAIGDTQYDNFIIESSGGMIRFRWSPNLPLGNWITLV